VLVGASSGDTGTYITEGSVTKLDWTDVVGVTSLTPGATYYLDTNAGKLTTVAPDGRGSFIVRVGKALSTTKIDIEIAVDILL